MSVLLYKLCKALGVFHLSRTLFRKKLTILCYHGFEVHDEASFRPKLFMRPEVFAERMNTLKSHGFNVLPLAKALDLLDANKLPPNSVAITIDDGFYSVLDKALPVLQHFEFPATLYSTSYYSEKRAPVFRLAIQYIFWKAACSHISLKGVRWAPTDEVIDLENSEESDRAMWAIIKHGEAGGDEQERQQISEELASIMNVDYQQLLETRGISLLTSEELKQVKSGNIDVQLHTHRHHFPVDDLDVSKKEINDNRSWISAVLNHDANHFCYPSGVWSSSQWELLRKLGVLSAVTCIPGMNTRKTPRYCLKRFVDHDGVSQMEFEAEIYGVKEFVRSFIQ